MRTILNYLIGRRKTIDEVLTIDETIFLLKNISKNNPKLRMNVDYLFLCSFWDNPPYREMIYSAEESAALVEQKFVYPKNYLTKDVRPAIANVLLDLNFQIFQNSL